jgi:predicted thioesterase
MSSLLKPGLKGEAAVKVTEENTAIAYGSGGVRVFATPAMIGLMEKAALSSVDPLLEKGQTTVGMKVDVEHLAATPVGMTVTARSVLLEVEGRKLVFSVEAGDGVDLVGKGMHVRFIVPEEKFLARAFAKVERDFIQRGIQPPLKVSRVHTGLNCPLKPAAYRGGGFRAD